MQGYPAQPSGPNVFSEAFKMFGKVFSKAGEAGQDPLTGRLKPGSGAILLGLYFIVVWWSLTFLLFGNAFGFYTGLGAVKKSLGSMRLFIKFGPALGFGALGAAVFVGARVGAAGLIKAFSGNQNVPFANIFTTVFVDTIILDCILVLMMLFQFATFYFAVFFMIIYFGMMIYQHAVLLRRVSVKGSSNKRFWCMFALICIYALVIMICYLIFLNMPQGAFDAKY